MCTNILQTVKTECNHYVDLLLAIKIWRRNACFFEYIKLNLFWFLCLFSSSFFPFFSVFFFYFVIWFRNGEIKEKKNFYLIFCKNKMKNNINQLFFSLQFFFFVKIICFQNTSVSIVTYFLCDKNVHYYGYC